MVWVWLPRFDRERVVLALAVLTPPILIGALANTLMAVRLSELTFVASDPESLLAALGAFKDAIELTTVAFFVIFGLLSVAALHATEDAMRGMVAFSTLTLGFLSFAVYDEWGFGTDLATAQLGIGIAFWGLGWVITMVHLFALLRATPHRKWTYVAGAVGLYQAIAFFLTLQIAVWINMQAAAVLLVLLGLLSAVIVFDNRHDIGDLWGYGLRRSVRLPDVSARRLIIVALYALIVFGLIGAEYQYHFDYVPRFALLHYVLLAAMTPVGVVLFGALSERGGRRTLLYGVPLVVAAGLIFQRAFTTAWPLAVAEGIMLGALPYLFQYLAEATRLLTRGSVYLFAMGAVAVLGVAGTFAAHFRAWTDWNPQQMLLLEFALMVVALAIAPQLPETRAQVSEEEELEDYLELARRVRTSD